MYNTSSKRKDIKQVYGYFKKSLKIAADVQSYFLISDMLLSVQEYFLSKSFWKENKLFAATVNDTK